MVARLLSGVFGDGAMPFGYCTLQRLTREVIAFPLGAFYLASCFPAWYWSRNSRFNTLPIALRGSDLANSSADRRCVLPTRSLTHAINASGVIPAPARGTT